MGLVLCEGRRVSDRCSPSSLESMILDNGLEGTPLTRGSTTCSRATPKVLQLPGSRGKRTRAGRTLVEPLVSGVPSSPLLIPRESNLGYRGYQSLALRYSSYQAHVESEPEPDEHLKHRDKPCSESKIIDSSGSAVGITVTRRISG
jgi:hypothetical protein